MKYKGKKIAKPTVDMVAEFLSKKGLSIDPYRLFLECEKSRWMTKAGRPTRSLEAYVSSRPNCFDALNAAKEKRRDGRKYAKKKTIPNKNKVSKRTKQSDAYSEILKDPRWQKRRLEIMSRDCWTCQECGCGLYDGVPLNVHHKLYHSGIMPWEYSDDELVTLCDRCHKKQHGIKDS